MRILAVILIGIIAGCRNIKHDAELIPSGKTISIILGNETRNFSNCIRLFKPPYADSSYLAISNIDFNRIEFYDLKSGKLAFIINFMRFGPDGIGSLRGFEIMNRDSILVFNEMANGGIFYLCNSSGKVLKKYNIPSNEEKYPFVPLRPSSVINNSVLIKNQITTIPSFISYQIDPYEEISKCKMLATVNLSDGTSNLLNLTYPVLYNKANQPVNPVYSSIYAKGKWFFSFSYSDYVFISEDLKSLQKVRIRSRYIKNDFKSDLPKDNLDPSKIISSPSYKSFYFDSTNNVFYRFVKHGDNMDYERDFITQNRYPQKVSVIIINEKLEIIGETKLPENRYSISMSFISPEGLYISRSNVYSSDFSEDTMKFELFYLKR